jgi:hypothetical protein
MLETLELSESVTLLTYLPSIFYISGYIPPIEVNPIGVVQEFHLLHSVQNSAVFILYPGRYIRINGAFRICQHC